MWENQRKFKQTKENQWKTIETKENQRKPMLSSISCIFSEVQNLEFLLKEQPEHKIIIKNKLNILFT